MSTAKQKKVAKLIIANATLDKPLNGGEMLEKVGYSDGIAKYPSRVLDSDGVKEELAVHGFTPEAAKTVVSKIMNDDLVEPNARLKAADMTFKVHGSYAPEKSVAINVDVAIDDKDLSLAQQLLDERTKSIKRGSEASSPTGDGVIPIPMGREVQD